MAHIVAMLDVIAEERAEHLRTLLPCGFRLHHATARGENRMSELIGDVDFAIAAQAEVTERVLRSARRLRLLHKWGVGVDNIDVAAARKLGISVARTTGSNSLAVAEFTVGLMLSSLRFQSLSHERLRQGHWMGFNELPAETFQLSGKTVGIIGFGATGQCVASLLKSFGCEIIYVSRSAIATAREQELRASRVTLPELLVRADIVSLHCPLTLETQNMIDAVAIAQMKSTAVLVNVARGGIVVERDLVDALRRKRIRGAAMDVFSVEPLPFDSDILKIDSMVVTPHLAAVAVDNYEPTMRRIFENMVRVTRGEPLPSLDLVA